MNKYIEYIKNNETINNEEEILLNQYIDFFQEENNIFDINFEETSSIENYIKMNKMKFTHKSDLENLDESAKLFIKFLKEHKRIVILTDNDLDGTSARSIATAIEIFLKRKYNYQYIYESMFTYGKTHGITFEQVDNLLDGNTEEEVLVVTADNGINNKEELSAIKEKYPNVKIIITDHHLANKENNIYDIVDYVLNPESVALDKKSDYLKIIDEQGKEYKTSYSGGYVFFLLMKEVLTQLKIESEDLFKEIEITALFSNIGDIIEYNLDVVQKLNGYSSDILEMFLLRNYTDNFTFFETFPEEKQNLKIGDYISKVISILNSTRRLSSVLQKFHSMSKEEFVDWMAEKFDINILEEKLDEKVLYDYLEELNKMSYRIYKYFYFVEDEKINQNLEKNIHFSYIKEMAVLLLLSNNSIKTNKDRIIISDAYSIVNSLNKLKNYLKKHIVDKKLYTTYKNDFFEVFFSNRDVYLREILSIQAFIEVDKNKSFLTLAKNFDKETNLEIINGSFRSKNSFSFKNYFLKDEKVKILIDKYKLDILILGHDKAAGIFFSSKGKNVSMDYMIEFFKEFNLLLIEEDTKLDEEKKIYLDLNYLQDIDVEKMLRIVNQYIYLSPHPHFKPIKFHVTKSNLEEVITTDIELKNAKSGSKYFNLKDTKNNTFLYFEQPNKQINLDEVEEFDTELNIKYNSRSNSFYYEMILNPKK